jgi:hypothetical protein
MLYHWRAPASSAAARRMPPRDAAHGSYYWSASTCSRPPAPRLLARLLPHHPRRVRLRHHPWLLGRRVRHHPRRLQPTQVAVPAQGGSKHGGGVLNASPHPTDDGRRLLLGKAGCIRRLLLGSAVLGPSLVVRCQRSPQMRRSLHDARRHELQLWSTDPESHRTALRPELVAQRQHPQPEQSVIVNAVFCNYHFHIRTCKHCALYRKHTSVSNF